MMSIISVLWSDLLGNLDSWCSCSCFCDTTLLNTAADQLRPHGNRISDGRISMELPKEHDKLLKVPQTPQISIRLSISGMHWKSNPHHPSARLAPCSNGSGVFRLHEGDPHNISQLVLILWLITTMWRHKTKSIYFFRFSAVEYSVKMTLIKKMLRDIFNSLENTNTFCAKHSTIRITVSEFKFSEKQLSK